MYGQLYIKYQTFSRLGSMSHASGVVYNGVWLNGAPLVEAAEISIQMNNAKYHEVGQGKRFEISAQIVDKEGSPVEGRSTYLFQLDVAYLAK